jgi:hypothetical protein
VELAGGVLTAGPVRLSLIDCHAHGKPVVVGGPDVDRVAERREGTDGLYRLSVFLVPGFSNTTN